MNYNITKKKKRNKLLVFIRSNQKADSLTIKRMIMRFSLSMRYHFPPFTIFGGFKVYLRWSWLTGGRDPDRWKLKNHEIKDKYKTSQDYCPDITVLVIHGSIMGSVMESDMGHEVYTTWCQS